MNVLARGGPQVMGFKAAQVRASLQAGDAHAPASEGSGDSSAPEPPAGSQPVLLQPLQLEYVLEGLAHVPVRCENIESPGSCSEGPVVYSCPWRLLSKPFWCICLPRT